MTACTSKRLFRRVLLFGFFSFLFLLSGSQPVLAQIRPALQPNSAALNADLVIQSTFDGDIEGWRFFTSGLVETGPYPAVFMDAAGNPPGALMISWVDSCLDAYEACTVTHGAPQKFLGDQSRAYRQAIRFDYRAPDYLPNSQHRITYQVYFYKLNESIPVLRSTLQDVIPGDQWNQVEIKLDETQSWEGNPDADTIQDVLSQVSGMQIAFLSYYEHIEMLGPVYLDNIQLERQVAGEPTLNTPYAMSGETVMLYAKMVGPDNLPFKSASAVTATLESSALPNLELSLRDDGAGGDVRAGDAIYTAWGRVDGQGSVTTTLYYSGAQVSSPTVLLELIDNPHLALLTDDAILYTEFLATGATLDEDQDGDENIDYYELIKKMYDYAWKYRGLVVDVRHNITAAAGFPADYADLLYEGSDQQTNRFKMASLIDQLLTNLHRDSRHMIDNIVLVGDDRVIPHYRIQDPVPDSGRQADYDNPTLLDRQAAYIMTDVPYGTVDHFGAGLPGEPRLQIPVGRIFHIRPGRVIDLFEAYETPLQVGPDSTTAALFNYYELPVDTFSARAKAHWRPLLARYYDRRDFRSAPPFGPGFYIYDGALVDWTVTENKAAWEQAGLSIITTHSAPTGYLDMDGFVYGSKTYLGKADNRGHILLHGGCFSGLSLSNISSSGTSHFATRLLSQSFLSRRLAYYGHTTFSTWRGVTGELSDYLMISFTEELLDSGSATVGEAYVHSWDGYWARHFSKEATNLAWNLRASYSPILLGLPTQPIENGGDSEVVAALSLTDGEVERMRLAGTGQSRQVSLQVEVPAYEFQPDKQGRSLVSPANGGLTVAEGEGWPRLPAIALHLELPAGAELSGVVEDPAKRVSQVYGPIELTSVLAQHEDGLAQTSTWPADGPYPSQVVYTDVLTTNQNTILDMLVVTGEYNPERVLGLANSLQLQVNYTLPAEPSAAILTVELGPSDLGGDILPLTATIQTDQARTVRLRWQAIGNNGRQEGSGAVNVDLPAGTSQAVLQLDAQRWPAGPKLINLLLEDPQNGQVLDSYFLQTTWAGLRLQAEASWQDDAGLLSLQITVRNESGLPLDGLANSFDLQIDGQPLAINLVEAESGLYTGQTVLDELSSGPYSLEIIVQDGRGLSSLAQAWFRIPDRSSQIFLPLTRR